MTSHADGHVKTISPAQITGEHGVALAKERTHAMGFLFTPYGPVEAGIDAPIELRDQATGQVCQPARNGLFHADQQTSTPR